MNRCDRSDPTSSAPVAGCVAPAAAGRRTALQRLLAGAAALAAWPFAAHAQRLFPMGARRGHIDFIDPPLVQLDGQTEQLGPGTRVHEARNNQLVFASTLKGQSYVVNYVRDGAATIREIWLLRPEEIQQELPPATTTFELKVFPAPQAPASVPLK